MNQAKQAMSIQGIAAAPGLAYGPVKMIKTEIQRDIPRSQENNPAEQQARMDTAVRAARKEISNIKSKILAQTNSNDAQIFDAHLSFLNDPVLIKKVSNLIGQGWNAEAAWFDTIEYFEKQLKKLNDPLLQARAMDIVDVGKRVLDHLMNQADSLIISPERPVVIAADDLSPSSTATLDKDAVLAFCLAGGSATSHASILAKALGIPAVVGLGQQFKQINENDQILINGSTGSVVINPTGEQIEAYHREKNERHLVELSDRSKANLPAVTRDGHQVLVVANIGNAEDAANARKLGADGVGLLRTEFLYLNQDHLPDEEYQVVVYREIAEIMGNLPLVVRTMDIGGDKAVPYLGNKDEANPFLGWRAIRMIDERPDILLSQFRSLLRGFASSQLHIMLPMVSSLDELEKAMEIFRSAREQLITEKATMATDVKFGIMVEVPATAILARQFAKHVDFFSIGTNDLTQYTLAVDRTNQRVAYLSSYFHPAVLQLIKIAIDAAHQEGKWVGLCGEMAGDPLAIPLLLGLGLDEFSMTPNSIPQAKRLIRSFDLTQSQAIADRALQYAHTTEVKEYLNGQKH
jgi:phosphoenolpyruvate-protein phosphotransferase